MTGEFEERFSGVDDGFVGGFIAAESGGHDAGHVGVYEGFLLVWVLDVCAEDGDDLGPTFFGVLLGHCI